MAGKSKTEKEFGRAVKDARAVISPAQQPDQTGGNKRGKGHRNSG